MQGYEVISAVGYEGISTGGFEGISGGFEGISVVRGVSGGKVFGVRGYIRGTRRCPG